MRNFILPTAASLAAIVALAAPASAATVITLNEADGTLSGDFGSRITSGTVAAPAHFSETFTFTLPDFGLTSASINTIQVGLGDRGAMTNLDFTSVLLNGQALNLSSIDFSEGGVFIGGIAESGFLFNLPTSPGLQTLVVNGLARGNGSFGGTVSFVPNAAPVPEPTTWALMLLGFAAVGFSMRRSKSTTREARVRYNFA